MLSGAGKRSTGTTSTSSNTRGGGKRKKRSTSTANSDSTSGESAVSTKSNAPSSTNGFAITGAKIRSILMHPIGLPLTSLLYDHGSLDNVPDELWSGLTNTDDGKKKFLSYTKHSHACNCDPNCTNRKQCGYRDYVFAAAVMKWEGVYETHLTQRLYLYISGLINDGFICGYSNTVQNNDVGLMIEREKGITKGFLDIVISKPVNRNDEKRSVVAIIEFGIECNSWWRKHHQILQYVESILSQNEKKYVIDQPLLLIVITVNKKEGGTKEQTKIHINDCRTQMKSINKDLRGMKEHRTHRTRFGVFLCMPKGECDYRMALLWRHDAINLRDASQQFGKVLYATQICCQLREHFTTGSNMNVYKYLGPNCCKIHNMVFRCYDNRLRATERRPDLYKSSIVLELADKQNNVLPFGQRLQLPLNKVEAFKIQKKWLWLFQGQLRIIAIQYYEGLHYATRPHQFYPIIKHLVRFHKHNFVHGDIRGYNMVFGTNNDSSTGPKGWLIDFDYGGTHNVAVYPNGYVSRLSDGSRPGQGGSKVTIMDDWKSLYRLVLQYYVEMPAVDSITGSVISPTLQEKGSISDSKCKLNSYNVMRSVDNNTISNYEELAKLLREYLDALGDKYSLRPNPDFEQDLRDCGFWKEVDTGPIAVQVVLKVSPGATGSLNVMLLNGGQH